MNVGQTWRRLAVFFLSRMIGANLAIRPPSVEKKTAAYTVSSLIAFVQILRYTHKAPHKCPAGQNPVMDIPVQLVIHPDRQIFPHFLVYGL